jgi:ribulose-bisphosphate carboxylase large chain
MRKDCLREIKNKDHQMSQYLDFVDWGHRPAKTDMICLFRLTPAANISFNEAVGRVASESSNGTWTELTTLKPHIRKIRARAFWHNKDMVKIAYPIELFENGSMPQLYSSVVGNIFGMKALEGLRLLDIEFPKDYVKSFKGPQFGIEGIRKYMKVYDRPFTATVPKPKVGMTSEEHAECGYEAWVGGVDFLKDDENLTDQVFNRFEKRVKLCAKMRDKAEKFTGEKKDYFINCTAETNEMIRRAKFAQNYDFKYVMIDMVTSGWSGLQTLRNHCQDSKQAIHAHRAMHATFTRNPLHGVSMLTLAKCAKLVGVDNIHIGTVVGKLVSPKDEVMILEHECEDPEMYEQLKQKVLHQNWFGMKPMIPVSSGGLHPGLIPYVLDLLGKDCCLQLGGGIHGHPRGTREGAKAFRQAIEAYQQGVSLQYFAEKNENTALKEALDHFGDTRPI